MARKVSAIVFDLDGTLTKPNAINFARLRERLQCPAGVDVLEYSKGRPDLQRIIEEEEEEALARVELNEGAAELFAHLNSRPGTARLFTGILTRNNEKTMHKTLAALPLEHKFDLLVSREWEGGPPKPHPAALQWMASTWKVPPEHCVMVGDWKDDILAGMGASFYTVAIGDDATTRSLAHHSVSSLSELIDLV